MEPAIFITYSSRDQRVARTICTALENRGLSCWISARDVKPGQNFQEQIVKAIRAARIMVLVFTANANNSSEIKKELALASQNRLVVIPVRIEDVIPNEAFAYEFATRQWVDLFGDWETAIAQLAEMVAATLEEQLPDGRAEAATAHTRRAGWRWAIIGGLAVIVAAAAIAYKVATLPQATVSAAVTKTGVAAQSEPAATSSLSRQQLRRLRRTRTRQQRNQPSNHRRRRQFSAQARLRRRRPRRRWTKRWCFGNPSRTAKMRPTSGNI